jgi:phenol hydroxylase P0 protein
MPDTTAFNPERKFIRIIQTHRNGMVEFEFAVGEPGLFVELLMPRAQFDDFCALHGVTPTQGRLAAAPEPEAQEWDWSLHAARIQSTRHDDPA